MEFPIVVPYPSLWVLIFGMETHQVAVFYLLLYRVPNIDTVVGSRLLLAGVVLKELL